jgi:alpha-L-fucosidase
MGGRDLLRPFVDTCRNHGLRAGLYYSPPDWYEIRSYLSFLYPGDPSAPSLGLRHEPIELPKLTFGEWEQKQAAHNQYVRNQVTELLGRYGKLDVLWFDGPAPALSIETIRELQPGILVNDRGHGEHLKSGDFSTYEVEFPQKRPNRRWELCQVWTDRAWGYQTDATFTSTAEVLTEFVKVRSWGGNYLLNVGPMATGELPEPCYARMAEMADWMRHSSESVIGAEGGPWPEQSNVPVTRRGGTWYLHFLPGLTEPARIAGLSRPHRARLLRTGQEVKFHHSSGTFLLPLPPEMRSKLVDVVAVST